MRTASIIPLRHSFAVPRGGKTKRKKKQKKKEKKLKVCFLERKIGRNLIVTILPKNGTNGL